MPITPARTRYIASVVPMTKDDFASTFLRAFQPGISSDRIRDSHHRIARLAAAGLRNMELSHRTGYSLVRLKYLLNSPAMVELIELYRGKVDKAFEANVDQYYEMATGNMLKAERRLADKLDDDDAEISVRDLVSISRDAADRFGYSKRQTNININADFAGELEKAIERSGKAKIVEAVALAPARRSA